MSIAEIAEKKDGDFIAALLEEQQSLTAVEQFSRTHDATADSCADTTAPDQAKYYRSLLPATPPSPGEQFAFEVDLDQCSGCKACVVACHTLNGLEEDESWRRVGTVTIGEPLPTVQHVTTACHHCEDPGCLNGCPVKAYEKDSVTGIVRHLDDQCIGCKYCTMMCPYEVPKYSDRLGIVRKCDMCHQRLGVGEAPACVQACPNEAIKITTVARQSVSYPDASHCESSVVSRLAPGAPDSSITRPTTQYVSNSVNVLDIGMPQDDRVDRVAESHWPLAALLIATQASVGILIVERTVSGLAWLAGQPMKDQFVLLSALASLIVAGVGMNVAPLHLGQPLRAWRVFLGLRTSWLSREAVILGQYVGMMALSVALLSMPLVQDYVPQSILDWTPSWLGSIVLIAAVPVGLAGLYSSAMIYIATRRQLWRSERTMIRFMGTALLGGLVGTATTTAWCGAGKVGFVLAMAAAVISVAKAAWEWRIHLGNQFTDSYDSRSNRLVRGALWRITQLRIAVGAAATGLIILGGLLAIAFATPATVILAVAFFSLLVSEFAERVLYFSSVVFDRMPGTL